MKNLIRHDDLSKPVYDRLKAMIENGALSPGQKLIQEKLAATLGVSRTPLLKALQSLEYEMLVESIPRRGMYVKQISTEEMINVYDCREAVECMAVRLVIERASDAEIQKIKKVFEPFINADIIDPAKYRKADEQFHDMIIDLSKNPILKKMSNVSDIHKRVYQFGLIRSPEDTLNEHVRIAQAIVSRNQEIAVKELKNHIGLSRLKLTEKEGSKNN